MKVFIGNLWIRVFNRKRDDIMRDLTRLASRIVMFFMQFYYRLARHSRVSYKAYIDGRTRLADIIPYRTMFCWPAPVSAGHLYLPRE